MSARILTTVRSVVRDALVDRGRIVLAVSGGLDSMVLLDAAAAAAVVDRAALAVANFDHGTGDWATRAQSLVERRARELGVQFFAGRAEAEPVAATEAALRSARWEFLHGVAARVGGSVATAHTEDDQIETALMRTLRGAGARGLAGLYADSPILRPLVHVRRAQLERYVRERNIEWTEDPTNRSRAYFRNRVRHDLLPALRHVAPNIDDELIAISCRAAEWRREVASVVDMLVQPTLIAGEKGVDVAADRLAELSRFELNILWPEVAGRAGLALDRRGLSRLSEFTKRGRVGRRVPISGGWQVVRSRERLELRRADTGGPTVSILSLSNSTRCGDWVFHRADREVEESSWIAWLPTDRALVVRRWQPGDSMRVGDASRKVKRLLSKAGVTGHKRMGWPVVIADNDIVWIPGVRRSTSISARESRSGLPFVCEYVNC